MSFTCICSDPDDFRLVGGTSRCNGRLQLKHNDEWREPYLTSPDRSISTLICHWLSCGSPISVVRGTQSTPPTWWLNNSCVQSHSLLRDCVITFNQFDHSRDPSIEMNCSGKCPIDKAHIPLILC